MQASALNMQLAALGGVVSVILLALAFWLHGLQPT